MHVDFTSRRRSGDSSISRSIFGGKELDRFRDLYETRPRDRPRPAPSRCRPGAPAITARSLPGCRSVYMIVQGRLVYIRTCFWATSRTLLVRRVHGLVDAPRSDFSRPTNSGITMWGYTTTSLRGSIGNRSVRNSDPLSVASFKRNLSSNGDKPPSTFLYWGRFTRGILQDLARDGHPFEISFPTRAYAGTDIDRDPARIYLEPGHSMPCGPATALLAKAPRSGCRRPDRGRLSRAAGRRDNEGFRQRRRDCQRTGAPCRAGAAASSHRTLAGYPG